jgi:hypothetical protein
MNTCAPVFRSSLPPGTGCSAAKRIRPNAGTERRLRAFLGMIDDANRLRSRATRLLALANPSPRARSDRTFGPTHAASIRNIGPRGGNGAALLTQRNLKALTCMKSYSPRNRLLLAVPTRHLKVLMEDFEFIRCQREQILLDADSSLDHIFFPESGVVSVVAVYADGNIIEMATIGREGCTGVQAAFGSKASSARLLVQIPGGAAKNHARNCGFGGGGPGRARAAADHDPRPAGSNRGILRMLSTCPRAHRISPSPDLSVRNKSVGNIHYRQRPCSGAQCRAARR